MVVSPELARECMNNFQTIMQGSNIKTVNASFSSSISFLTPQIAEWLYTNNYLTNSVNLEICLGIYTQAVVNELKLPERYVGRLTVFIWPTKAADTLQKIENDLDANDGPNYYPFNSGEIKP